MQKAGFVYKHGRRWFHTAWFFDGRYYSARSIDRLPRDDLRQHRFSCVERDDTHKADGIWIVASINRYIPISLTLPSTLQVHKELPSSYISLCFSVYISVYIKYTYTYIYNLYLQGGHDKTAKNMLGNAFRRELLMDGQYGQICFIATQSSILLLSV
jgi:hypothetical protein